MAVLVLRRTNKYAFLSHFIVHPMPRRQQHEAPALGLPSAKILLSAMVGISTTNYVEAKTARLWSNYHYACRYESCAPSFGIHPAGPFISCSNCKSAGILKGLRKKGIWGKLVFTASNSFWLIAEIMMIGSRS